LNNISVFSESLRTLAPTVTKGDYNNNSWKEPVSRAHSELDGHFLPNFVGFFFSIEIFKFEDS